MARILIAEPHPEVRQLFVHFISALGHEAVVHERGVDPVDVDALVVEPALPGAYELVESLRLASPGLPVIAVSVYPPSELPIGLEWTSFHVKPFGLSTLREALTPHLSVAA